MVKKIKEISATPWSMHERPSEEVIYKKNEGDVQASTRLAQMRRLYIRQSDLEEFGFTQSCKCCQNITVYGKNSGTMSHSDACRARIMAALDQTEVGRVRIAKMNARTDKFLEETLKRHVEGEAAGSQGRSEDKQEPVAAPAADPQPP
jgi:hypothetical protein